MERYEQGLFRVIYDNYRNIWKFCGLIVPILILLNIVIFNIPYLTITVCCFYLAIVLPCGIIAKKVDNFERKKLAMKLAKELGE